MTQNTDAGNTPGETKQKLAITATFTAEPIEDALNYWMTELGFPFQIEFAPYNQVFQQLFDPASLLSHNEKGINIVLVRLEDWQRFHKADQADPRGLEEKLEQNTSELVQALQSAVARSATPILVCVCPASPMIAADEKQAAFFQEMETRLTAALEPTSGVHLITSAELAGRYPVKEYYDAYSDEVGHIPYTTAFFTALATMLARKIYALQTPARKVIVLDCDNTLWKGICGESGPSGVEIDAPYRALQEFMLAQHAAGRLLCLCSKNSETDVFDVFAHRPEMPLKRDHILAWRINWQPKSENLVALAEELQLGLDSFIFLDDNPVECAEVQAHCPEVLTLQLPQQPERISRFLNNVWPFDYLKITETDRQRTELYRQNMEREHARQEASTFEDFLASLQLEIQISAMLPEHVERVAQLTQRTNQFNTTTIRRTESEIQLLSRTKNLEFRVVEVRDRFGDYGLVGVMAFGSETDVLQVDTFLLSCRVLGRSVEHQMWKELGKIALAKELNAVAIPFLPTPKNQPAFEFLNKVGADYRQPAGQDSWLFVFPAQIAIGS
jgi:FkbH-like protein